MKNHFYMKGFRPLRITACGGCGGWPHGCGGCGGYYDYSTAHFGNPPTWVSITKHEGTVEPISQFNSYGFLYKNFIQLCKYGKYL